MVDPCLRLIAEARYKLLNGWRQAAWCCLLVILLRAAIAPSNVLAADIEADGSDCALADAITAANTDTETNGCTAGDGADTITLSADVTLSAALPTIAAELTIDGDSHFISGADTYAILVVEDADLTVMDVTLKEGSAVNGGAIYIQDGTLIVDDVVITENAARDHGGGIYASNGTLDIKGESEISHNEAGDSGGGIWTNNVNATLVDVEVSENETGASGGGGMYFTTTIGSALGITTSTFRDNTAVLDGGGLRMSNGVGSIVRSSFTENTADDGGAIKSYNATLSIENTTLSTNTARIGAGFSSLGSHLTFTHVTLADNTATERVGGLLINGSSGSLKLRNTLISRQVSGGDCDSGPNPDMITENVGNIIQDGSCAPTTVVETTATPGVQEQSISQFVRAVAQQSEETDEQEKPDMSIGGLTGEKAYHPLNQDSPAIDSASQMYCLAVDQLGTLRPQGGDCDVGAFELPIIVPTETPRPTATRTPTATLTPTPSPTFTPTLTPTPVRCMHAVVAGDTLYDIALTYDTTVDALSEINQLNDDLLAIGQELFIPNCEFTPQSVCEGLPTGTELRTDSGNLRCEVVEISDIDKHPLMNPGIIVAFDVWGIFGLGAEVCTDQVGTIVFMDDAFSPPQVTQLETESRDDKICADLAKAGTAVLVQALSEESSIPLTDCQLTTANVVRLRDEAGGENVSGASPLQFRLVDVGANRRLVLCRIPRHEWLDQRRLRKACGQLRLAKSPSLGSTQRQARRSRQPARSICAFGDTVSQAIAASISDQLVPWTCGRISATESII